MFSWKHLLLQCINFMCSPPHIHPVQPTSGGGELAGLKESQRVSLISFGIFHVLISRAGRMNKKNAVTFLCVFKKLRQLVHFRRRHANNKYVKCEWKMWGKFTVQVCVFVQLNDCNAWRKQ